MKFRGIDSSGDSQFGQGLGSYAQGQGAISLDIAANLRSWKNNCFFAPSNGVDYKNLLDKGQLRKLEIALQNAILQTNGVVKILTFAFKLNPVTRALSMTCTVQTVYSQQFVVTLQNITGGNASA